VTGAGNPEWLIQAFDAPPTHQGVEVEGAYVHYLEWGPADGSPVVLVHGGLAHAHWWDHIAPHLAGHRVVALDLSGHGDSETRVAGYDMMQWGREIVAVIRDAGMEKPVVVGHSMGGYPSVASGIEAPTEILGVITLDSRFNDQEYSRGLKKSREFASLDEALAHFNPVHSKSALDVSAGLLRHIGETSLRREGGSWRWKRDDNYWIRQAPLRELLPKLQVPFVIVQTEYGLVSDEHADEMRALTLAPSVAVKIPGAGHNPMLEQPLALISVLRTLLATHLHSGGVVPNSHPLGRFS